MGQQVCSCIETQDVDHNRFPPPPAAQTINPEAEDTSFVNGVQVFSQKYEELTEKAPKSPTSPKAIKKKKEIKVVVGEFREAATAGISCISMYFDLDPRFGVDENCIVRARSTLFLKEKEMTIKIAASKDPEQFFELRLKDINAFDHDKYQMYDSENQHACHLLKRFPHMLGPEEDKLSAFVVHGKEVVCLLLEDSDTSFKTFVSLRVLSDFARAQGKGKRTKATPSQPHVISDILSQSPQSIGAVSASELEEPDSPMAYADPPRK